MFTAEQLESTWNEMREFEQVNFGLKFGEEFPQVAQVLRDNKHFMSMGMIITMLSALEMSGLSKEMQDASDKDAFSKKLMERPTGTHNTLAELFYLGYRIGKQCGEVAALEKLTMSK